MAIPAGSRLGPHEVLNHIGSGGMGDVYRAHDRKLGRDVAIKVLPPAFARDPDRLTRFRREARVLASLNHTNIAAIYGLEDSGQEPCLVLEYVPGETLAARIKRSGPVPLDEAMEIAKQIAEALEAAHEKGVIHRDLKPGNVKITPEGKVKVLDFGLARAFADEEAQTNPSDISTVSKSPTIPGVILGTPAYMSPEQAKGKPVDKRTDIWALGCVLFEMLTGKQTFAGESVTEVLGAILHKEPEWVALPENTPAQVRFLLRRCLEKDAKRRFRDAADLQIQMEEAHAVPAAPMVEKAARTAPLRRWALPWAAAVVLSALVGVAVWNFRPTPEPQTVSRFTVQLPPEDRIQLTFDASVAISPDGSQFVYRGTGAGGQLYLRSLDSPEVKPIPGTQGGVGPFFSPDGQWLGFSLPGKLMKVALDGGPPVTLCECLTRQGGATWGPDDTIVFSAPVAGSRHLYRIHAGGGTPTVLAKPDSAKGEIAYAWPEFLPGGKTVLFTIQTGISWDNAQIGALNLESGEQRILVQGGTYPRYAPTGHLVYWRTGTVMAVPFDLEHLEITGAPAPVLEGVMSSLTNVANPTGSGAAQFGLSQTGALVYIAGVRSSERTLVWVDRKGAVQPLGAPPRAYLRPALSPDGKQVAVNIVGQTGDLWIYNIARSTLARLTFEGNNNRPVWTRDGLRIAFPSDRAGSRSLFWKLVDGSGAEEQLTNDKLFSGLTSISPDGKLAFVTLNLTGENDLGTVELQGERKRTVFLKTRFDESVPAVSPDGRWVAYASDESGRAEIYVRAFPGPGGKWEISTEGGVAPVWARNGRELFYANGGKLMVVDITTQPGFQAGTPRVLLEGAFQLVAGAQGSNFDISPDGQRFLMIKGGETNLTQLNVVLEWFEELKRRVPVR